MCLYKQTFGYTSHTPRDDLCAQVPLRSDPADVGGDGVCSAGIKASITSGGVSKGQSGPLGNNGSVKDDDMAIDEK